MNSLRPAFMLVGFVALTLPLMPVQQLLIWFWPKMAEQFPHWYHRGLCRLLAIKVEVRGMPPQRGPALLVANHVSWIDIVALSAIAPVCFVAKREVARWPLFGALARLQRSVFIDRDRRHRAGEARDSISRRLSEGGLVVLFAEGTSGDGATVRPFRSALLGAADDPGIPVVPVTLAYTRVWNLPMTRRLRPRFAWYGDMELVPHLWQAMATGPVAISIAFHPPLTAESRKSRKILSAAAETTIREGLVRALHGRDEMG